MPCEIVGSTALEGFTPLDHANLFLWLLNMGAGEFLLVLVTLALVLSTIGLCYYSRSLVKRAEMEHWFSIYFEYNRRFSEILMKIFDYKHQHQTQDQIDDEMVKLMTNYFNLCLEEYTLERKKIINDPKLWNQWRQGIINYLGRKEFQEYWDMLRNNKCYPDDFRIYMDTMRNLAINQSDNSD